jgi:hypothetical protein
MTEAPVRGLCRLGCPILHELANTPEADEDFLASTSVIEQYYHACRILRDERPDPTPYSVIGALFAVNKGTIRKQVQKFKDGMQLSAVIGRPSIFAEDQLEHVKRKIIEQYDAKCPMSIAGIGKFISSEFGLNILPNTLHHILARDPTIKSCKATAMDAKRTEVTAEQIQAHFATLFATLSGAPAHFVFNMDEMGHQEWADAPDNGCVVPISHGGNRVYYPVSRTGKRITLLACVAADGSYLKPAVVITRKTYDDDLVLYGLTSEKVERYSQDNGYVATPIFDDWVRTIFIPELMRRREAYCSAEPAFLILDNCSAHTTGDFRDLASDHHIIPIFLPPHSSNQTQVLDLSVFGITKRLIARVNRIQDANIQGFHIAQVVCSFMSAVNPVNVVQSFKNAGISLLNTGDGLLCVVTPETARCLMEPDKVLTRPDLFPHEELDDETEDDDIDEDVLDSLSRDLL